VATSDPQPIQKINATKKIDERSFSGALLRGEGSAMAGCLEDGTDARIPCRGEIGLTSTGNSSGVGASANTLVGWELCYFVGGRVLIELL
jgi:hypothetical protein